MAKIEAIERFFAACPLLEDYGGLRVDFLDEAVKSYSINPYLSGSVTIKTYTDGAEIRQYPFYFESTEPYSRSAIDTRRNSEWYEEFASWIEEQNKNKNFPDIQGVIKIEILSDGYMVDAAQDTAVYQIQLRLLYYRKGNIYA